MALTRKRADLVLEILENLGVLAAGQTVGPEDTSRVDEKLPSTIAYLAAAEVVSIPDLDAIPQEFFQQLSDICAYELRAKFGVVGDFAATLEKKNAEAYAAIKVMTRGRPTGEIVKGEFF